MLFVSPDDQEIQVPHIFKKWPNEDGSCWRKVVRNKMVRMKEV